MIESFWRHLDASEACAAQVEMFALRETRYPKALSVERVVPGLPGMPTSEAIRRLAEQAGIGNGGPLPVHGIELNVGDRRFRGLLRAVLDRLADGFPEDLARVRRRVSRVERIQPSERTSTVAGSYGDANHGAPERIPGPDGRPEEASWPVGMSQRTIEGPRERLVEVLVHELGHAASTPEDVRVRSGLGREWGSELAADHHAAKWGFGGLIASQRSDRCVAHHGPVPGEKVVVTFEEHRFPWRITDDRIPVREGLMR